MNEILPTEEEIQRAILKKYVISDFVFEASNKSFSEVIAQMHNIEITGRSAQDVFGTNFIAVECSCGFFWDTWLNGSNPTFDEVLVVVNNHLSLFQ